MKLPANFELAGPAWRFVAGGINLLVFGCITMVAEFAAKRLGDDGARAVALVGITGFWLVWSLRRKSLGGAFCLLEIRSADFAPLLVGAYLVRTLPYYLLAFLACFPLGILPPSLAKVQLLFLIGLIVGLGVDAICLVLTRRSLLDRWTKTEVLRLNLPAHLRPRFFGIRIS
ncbi:MAG TPA: hypothetical protein VGD88_14475 [Opitutaceae bacterium]